MYNKRTISVADTTIINYSVDMFDLPSFITDTAKRYGLVAYESDLLIDYNRMVEHMRDGVGYMWSIRDTGTWFMPVIEHAILQPDRFTTPNIRFIVTKNGEKYNFTEYKTLDQTRL